MGVETFITIDRVAQVDTAFNPDDNMYTVRLYGRDGELIQEQQVSYTDTRMDGEQYGNPYIRWKIPEEEEQPDVQEERGGVLDEFLEKFTPQKTTPERGDEQE